jgi:hypothetical protein
MEFWFYKQVIQLRYYRTEPSTAEMTPVKEIVNEFCILQEWPVPLSQLNDACKK